MTEADYKKLRDLFIRIAKSKYPSVYNSMKQLQRVPARDGKPATYEIRSNEITLLLLHYLNIELEGKKAIVKEVAFERILNDIICSDEQGISKD